MSEKSEKIEPPKALVKPPKLIRYGGLERPLRVGRGFSIPELREVGLDPKTAMKLGLYVDKRRRTKHEWNVRMLREFLEKIRKQQKSVSEEKKE